MPKYMMLGAISGTRDGVDWPKPGEIVELPEDEAASLLVFRVIVPVEVEEHAVASSAKVETATPRRGRKS